MPLPTQPLQGFRVLDLTNVLAGPFCGHQLAHLGAEVIKVEIPGDGDLARSLGALPELNQKGMGTSFIAQNVGKRSITINLKKRRGKALLKELVGTADVLIENFRPGVMDRLELGYETLRELNPSLVYCAISGFGQDGPLANTPAYDQIVQGLAGVMSITGGPDAGPYRVGYPMADTIGGLTAAFAIAAALAGRSKHGEQTDPPPPGCFIDVSMLEAVLASMGWVVSNYLLAHINPERMGNENFTASPSGTFATGEGLLNIAANKQQQFESTCVVVGRRALITDPRFKDPQSRLDHRYELKALLEEALVGDSAANWVTKLTEAGVPAGCVVSVPEILEHPQIRDRGILGRFSNVPGVAGEVCVLRTGIKINQSSPSVTDPPPMLGEHTETVLRELGHDETTIQRLKEEGIV